MEELPWFENYTNPLVHLHSKKECALSLNWWPPSTKSYTILFYFLFKRICCSCFIYFIQTPNNHDNVFIKLTYNFCYDIIFLKINVGYDSLLKVLLKSIIIVLFYDEKYWF